MINFLKALFITIVLVVGIYPGIFLVLYSSIGILQIIVIIISIIFMFWKNKFYLFKYIVIFNLLVYGAYASMNSKTQGAMFDGLNNLFYVALCGFIAIIVLVVFIIDIIRRYSNRKGK